MNYLSKIVITIALFFGMLISVNAENKDINKLERVVQKMVRPEGFKHPTPWFVARYSINYKPNHHF